MPGKLFGGSRLERILNYEEARRAARRVLPRLLFDYVDGGADDEHTLRCNTVAFAQLKLRQRVGEWVPAPDLSTKIFGIELSMPVLTAPCGGMRLVHPEGDVAVTRAAARAGIIPVVPSGGGYSLEDVATAPGPKWFQLYKFSNRGGMEKLVAQTVEARYGALVLTLDTGISGKRERDFRNGFSYDLRVNAKSALRLGPQMVQRPGWLYRFWRDGMPFELPNTAQFGSDGRSMSVTEMARGDVQSFSPTWEDLTWARANWSGPLIVKGVLDAEDARRAVDLGADGIIVSNHGGRQLDNVPATVDVLPAVADAVGGRVTILLDSGVRRGSDVIKALALGADAVLLGRPVVWGLAAGGEAGVGHMLELIRGELTRTMSLMGCAQVAQLNTDWVIRTN